MSNKIPTIGQSGIYKPTKEELKEIEFGKKGFITNKQKELPAVIVAVWGDTPESAVNLKVMIDGDKPDLWATSVTVGKIMGTWRWPVTK